MQITIPDELVMAGKLIAITMVCTFVVALAVVGAWHIVVPDQMALVQSTVTVQPTIAPTPAPTPTPAPAAFSPYWTGSLEITGMQTGSGPQIDCANGQSFYVSWQDYYQLQLHQLVSFYVVSTSQPWNTVMFNADQVVVTGYAWGYDNNPYNDRYTRVVSGSAGRFCIDGNSKYSC